MIKDKSDWKYPQTSFPPQGNNLIKWEKKYFSFNVVRDKREHLEIFVRGDLFLCMKEFWTLVYINPDATKHYGSQW